jgi:hypothetical protein
MAANNSDASNRKSQIPKTKSEISNSKKSYYSAHVIASREAFAKQSPTWSIRIRHAGFASSAKTASSQ